MYHDINRILLTGFVHEAPEVRRTEGGKSYTTFLLRCLRRGKYRREQPDLFFVRASGNRLAARCNDLVPGMRVLVEGRLQSRTDDTRNGIIWFACHVRVRRLLILRSPPDWSGSVVVLPRSPLSPPSTLTLEVETCSRL